MQEKRKLQKLDEIKKYLTITKNQIKARKNAEVFIDKTEYKEDSLIETAKYYVIPGLIDIYFPEDDVYIELPFMFDVHLYKTSDMVEEKDFIIIRYKEGDVIINQKYKSAVTDFKLFNRLFEAGAKFVKTPEQLVLFISKMLNHSIDLVHIEVLVQHIYRCKDNPQLPGRLCGYEKAENIGVSKIPYIDSWLLGIEFEKIDRAIKNALINKVGLANSPFEKLFLDY